MKQKAINKWLQSQFLEWQMQEGELKKLIEFAEYLGVSQSNLSRWINGQANPTGGNVAVLASRLGLEIYDILGLPRPHPTLQKIIAAWGEMEEGDYAEFEQLLKSSLEKSDERRRDVETTKRSLGYGRSQ